MAKIKARGKIIAGVKYDFKPFGFVDAQGKNVGFDIDLIHEFAKRWLGDANAVDLVQVTSKTRIPMLAEGKVDLVAASMTHTKPRDDTIDFSVTYFMDGQSLLVKKGSGINSVKDLDGKVVTAIQGSTSIDNIKHEAEKEGIKIQILPLQEYPQAIQAVKDGRADALTTDSTMLMVAAQDNPELEVVGGLFTSEPYGMGVPRFDAKFRDLVNFTLQDIKADGTYDKLYHKWFGAKMTPWNVEIWPGKSYIKLGK